MKDYDEEVTSVRTHHQMNPQIPLIFVDAALVDHPSMKHLEDKLVEVMQVMSLQTKKIDKLRSSSSSPDETLSTNIPPPTQPRQEQFNTTTLLEISQHPVLSVLPNHFPSHTLPHQSIFQQIPQGYIMNHPRLFLYLHHHIYQLTRYSYRYKRNHFNLIL